MAAFPKRLRLWASHIFSRSRSTRGRHPLARKQWGTFETLEPRTLLAGDITLVRYFDTWNAGIIKSTDPAGIVYHPPSGSLFIADSEINETRWFTGKNVFQVSLKGDRVIREYATGNSEPTGITYNEFDQYFYVINDDTRTITRYNTNLNSPLATVKTTAADAALSDPEDIASDPSGNLYVMSGGGGGKQPWVGVFDANLKFRYKFAVSTQIVKDPEGIAYNKANQHLYLVSDPSNAIVEYTTDGTFLQKYDISKFSPAPNSPQGLTFGPTSDPDDDPEALSVYIADGGVDNGADGHIYEARIGSTVSTAPVISSFSPASGPAGTVVTLAGSNFTGTTAVRFNGTAAGSFTIDSNSQLRATVPSGATTGPIQVTNAGGSTTSTSSFTVTTAPAAPQISSFSPTSGPAGTVVTLLGSNFTGTTAVRFNGTAASSFTIDSNSQLRATVPSGATTGPIQVTNAGGIATSTSSFTVTTAPAAPQISSFSPTSGPVGTVVTLLGSNFTGTTAVRFNGTAAASFTIDSNSQLRATVPAGATTGPIQVTNAGGSTSSSSNFTVTGSLPVTTFMPAQDAHVKSTSPTARYGSDTIVRLRAGDTVYNGYLKFEVTGISGPVQSAKVRLYVTDPSDSGGAIYLVSNNYRDTSTPWVESGLTWNNAPLIGGSPLSSAGAVQQGAWVEFDVTPAISGSGTYSFALTSASTNSVYYSSKEGTRPPELVIETGASAVPQIASFSPSSGPAGTEVTVLGSNFTGATQVRFNGTLAASVIVDSSTQLRAVVPTGATTGPVSVTNADGTHTSASNFTVLMAPAITGFTPTSGPAGTEVTISGSGFSGVTEVRFNGTLAGAILVDSDRQLRATVPAGAATGPIQVTNAVDSATSAASFTVTVPPPVSTFLATHDAHVKSTSPTNSYGSYTIVRLRDGDTIYHSYLKFEISGISGPVRRATVRLYVDDPSNSGGSIYLVSNDYRDTGTPWVESGLNWNNAPLISGTPLSSVTGVALGTWIEFDVTAAISGAGTYSFGLANTSTNSVLYSSSEGDHPPELVIEN